VTQESLTADEGRPRRARAFRVVAVVAVSVGAVAALIPARDHVRNTNLALALVLVVLAGAAVGGRMTGLVAGAVVAVAFDFFLTQPYQSFTIDKPDDIQTTVLLAAVGLVGGELVERARRSQAQADSRRREIERFRRRAELAAWGERPGRLISLAGEELTDLLGLLEVTYCPGPPPRDMCVLTHNGARIPGGPSSSSLDVIALPIRAHGRDIGHFRVVFPPATGWLAVSADRRHSAVALADQLGVALLRYRHE
jgi:K+-sensing histidine kinase KdpD